MPSENPFMARKRPKGIDHGKACESKFAKRIGGTLTPNSGASGTKGDVRAGRFRVELKSTINASISVKLEHLNKINKEARECNKYPALGIQFVTGDGEIIPNGSWVCVRESDFKNLMAIAEQEPE